MTWRERLREYVPMDPAKRARLGDLIFDASPHQSEAWDRAVQRWTPIAVMWGGLAVTFLLFPGYWWAPIAVLLVGVPVSFVQYVRYPEQDVRLYERGVLATLGHAQKRVLGFRGAMQMAFLYQDIESVSWREPGMLVLTVPKKNKLRTTSVVAFVPESRRAEVARLLPLLVAQARSRGEDRARVSRPLVSGEGIGW